MTPRAVVIVGAGLAGARAAETLRAEGFDGRVVLVGEEPTAPYERPALSKEFLAGTRDEASLLLRPASFWDERGIELVLGERVETLDPAARRVRTSRGRELALRRARRRHGRPRPAPAARASARRAHAAHAGRRPRPARGARPGRAPRRRGRRLRRRGGGLDRSHAGAPRDDRRGRLRPARPRARRRTSGSCSPPLARPRSRRPARRRRRARPLRTPPAGSSRSGSPTAASCARTSCSSGSAPSLQRELLPRRLLPNVAARGRRRRPRALDRGRAGRRCGGAADPRPPGAAAAAALRLVRSVRPAPPGRRHAGPDDAVVVDGTDESFAVRYLDSAGLTRAGLLANRPTEAAALRRELQGAGLPLAA